MTKEIYDQCLGLHRQLETLEQKRNAADEGFLEILVEMESSANKIRDLASKYRSNAWGMMADYWVEKIYRYLKTDINL